MGRVKGMLVYKKCMYCTNICITRAFMLLNMVCYITFAVPTSTLPTSLLKQMAPGSLDIQADAITYTALIDAAARLGDIEAGHI